MRPRTIVGTGLVVLLLFFRLHVQGHAQERYTVKPGDSLVKIAQSRGVSVQALKRSNGLKTNLIQPSQVLLIPGEVSKIESVSHDSVPYKVKKGDTLSGISKKTGVPVKSIREMNHLESQPLKAGQMLILSRAPSKSKEIRKESDGVVGNPEFLNESERESKGLKEEAGAPISKWNNLEERSLLVRVVKTFLGVPYRLGGSTLKGIDCSAFVKRIYEIFNVTLPRTALEQFRIGKKVEKERLEEGDLVFFKTPRPAKAHVGISIGNNEIVHASYSTQEVTIDNLESPYFSQRFLKGVRVKELEEET